MVSAFTAAHPVITQILILWPALALIASVLWAWCIPPSRDDEEDEPAIPQAPGLKSQRKRIG